MVDGLSFKMKNFQFFFIFVLIGLIGTIGLLELLPSFGESNENQRQPTSLEPKNVKGNDYSPKIHPHIVKIMNDSQPESRALSYGASYQNDELDVYVYLKPEFIKNPPKNFNVIAQDENIVYTRLSLAQIQSISDLESVDRISLPIKAVTFGHAVSQGVAWSFADVMQAAGFTGSGIIVAVIDDSFDVSNSEISGNILSQSVGVECIPANMLCGQTAGNSHGTAVAEAVVDMAPDVNLRLYATGGLVDSNLAITDAISNDVDIITISFGFPSLGGDGVTGDYRDGTSSIAKKVNDAKNAGILVTVSAGNSGDSHWSGTYSISPVTPLSIGLNPAIYESLMNFRPSQSGLQRACLPVTDIGDDYYLTWNDWAASNQDYDFFLYSSDMTTPLDFSVDFQTGSQNPIENIPATGPFSPTTLCLVIASASSTENHFFHIDTTVNLVNSPNLVKAGSLSTPADATGALTVGAIDQSTDILETFSSRGPTDDSRNKPEICGPDNTLSHQTLTGDLNPFFGTSSATPHVAGAAALLTE